MVESFDEGVGFSWRAYRNLRANYTCMDSAMSLFVDTIETITALVSFDEIGITYLAATNAVWLPCLADEGIRFVHYPANRVRMITYLAATNAVWLPCLADEGIRFVHYPANRVRRQFGLD